MSMPFESDYDRLSLESKSRIDAVCLQFEDAWKRGQHVDLQDYLDQVEGEERAVLFHELLLIELEYVRREGTSVSSAAYRERFPEFAKTVERVFLRIQETPLRAPLEAGQQVGRYIVQEQLGQGSFGAVYAAWDEELRRSVAIKAPRPEAVASPKEAQQIIAEARAAGGLQHRSIVPIYDVLRDEDGVPLIIMEHVQGPTLRERIERERLPLRETLRILIEIAEAIDYAHREGFVHRDLEPGNIVLDENGEPRILDFGLALHVSVQSSKAGESAGSLAYMSPEQVRGESDWLDGRADIWALGVMLYEMLTGQCPFQGETMGQLLEEILGRDPRPPRQIDRHIPAELERICLTCLRKHSSERYATARDFAEALQHVYARLEPEEGASRPGGESATPRHLRRALLCVLVMAVTLAALALGWWLADSRTAVRSANDTRVDLRVWNASQKQRNGASIREPHTLPLRTGDLVRMEAQFSRPLYAYLLWIDSEGSLAPVYPWLSGDWEQRAAVEKPIERIALPAEGDQAWTVQECPSGTESVVVLARDKPLPPDFDLVKELGPLKSQAGPSDYKFLELKDGRFQHRESPQKRSINLRKTESIHEAVLANQQQIADRLGQHFDLHYSINFPVRGSSPP
jgi:hypothetical protein